eukprot:9489939-Pyramimonas_sp.AAC.1
MGWRRRCELEVRVDAKAYIVDVKGSPPGHDLADGPLGLHAARAVVQVCKLKRNLRRCVHAFQQHASIARTTGSISMCLHRM